MARSSIDFNNFPNVLIGGTTGYGKTQYVLAEVMSLLKDQDGDDINFIICPSKEIDYAILEHIPHALISIREAECNFCQPTDLDMVLRMLMQHCEERLRLFKAANCLDIGSYVEYLKRSGDQNIDKMPHQIFLIIDDLTTCLTATSIELLAQLTAKNRSTGIYVIGVTSQISSRLISNNLKSNFNLRICFKVMSASDSKKVLGYEGAEKLSAIGDYLSSEKGKTLLHGKQFTDQDLLAIQNRNRSPRPLLMTEQIPDTDFDPEDMDSLFEDAARLIVLHQQGSTALIQRKLKLGYNRAGRLIDQLEAAGVVGPFEGSKAREVLLPDDYALEQFLDNLHNYSKPQNKGRIIACGEPIKIGTMQDVGRVNKPEKQNATTESGDNDVPKQSLETKLAPKLTHQKPEPVEPILEKRENLWTVLKRKFFI